MPSTYSKRRHGEEASNTGGLRKKKAKGGPLKRTADEAIRESLLIIPANKLPLKRQVLQRYRHLRIMKSNSSVGELTDIIALEVKSIWGKAMIPTVDHADPSHKNVSRAVKEVIEEWNRFGKRPEK